MKRNWIPGLLWLCAAYDGVLGAAFLLAGPAIFRSVLQAAPPNHWGYVHFPAALLLAFAAGFAVAATDPARHRVMLLMGVLFKVSYVGVVMGHWATGSMPALWVIFAWIDLAFLAAFVAAWRAVR
jgi:hypothetical protein